ncbi:MAG TPA: hypothetical protein VKK79_06710 [Candidatus Lokiarchaeia archaeon]|nr:hypothetical protein [Candidatus Lokiarchaeia archaeon]
MQDIILRILSKQGFDLSTEEGRRYYDAMTAAYGEDFPLEPEKCFFAKHVAYFRLTHVGDIQLELGGIWVGTPYGEGIAKEWFPWDEILEIGLLSGDGGLGPYAILAADVEEFFRAGRGELVLTGTDREQAKITKQYYGEGRQVHQIFS